MYKESIKTLTFDPSITNDRRVIYHMKGHFITDETYDCYGIKYGRNKVMVAFIMLGMAKFHENSKIKPGVTQKPYNERRQFS